jgi:hypothetical protein
MLNVLSGNQANPQLTKQARRLYVGNLPVGAGLTEQGLTEYFSQAAVQLGIKTPQPVLSSWLSQEGTFCFVEFRSVQDCTFAVGLLQGLTLGGRALRIGRPADYKPPPPALENYVVGGTIPAAVGSDDTEAKAGDDSANIVSKPAVVPVPSTPAVANNALRFALPTALVNSASLGFPGLANMGNGYIYVIFAALVTYPCFRPSVCAFKFHRPVLCPDSRPICCLLLCSWRWDFVSSAYLFVFPCPHKFHT